MKPIIDATSTPLSSIFGSGFLIIVPILAGAVGPWSVLAMAGRLRRLEQQGLAPRGGV